MMVVIYAGIDVGSLSTEVVLVDNDHTLLGYSIIPTGADGKKAANNALDRALEEAQVSREKLGGSVATGYGRISISFARDRVTEISCHARGVHHLYPEARTVIDIGGQDSKVIRLNQKGRAVDFVMNDKCAAGTGRFLEVMARALEMEVEDLAEISTTARQAVPISNMCAVFAESEVVSLLAAGNPREEIVRGLHEAVAERTQSLINRVGGPPPLIITGGVAKNRGVVRALEKRLETELYVPEEPQITGALGAAIFAAQKAEQGVE